jgi:superfamily II DNA/RNA helicase
LNMKHIKHFILDECDKMLEQLGKIWSLEILEKDVILTRLYELLQCARKHFTILSYLSQQKITLFTENISSLKIVLKI